MKVKNTIRISKENINALRNLECVESIEQNGRDITVRLKPEYTDGKLEARNGEYLIQWGTKCGRDMALRPSICFLKIPERRPARHGTRRFKEVLRS